MLYYVLKRKGKGLLFFLGQRRDLSRWLHLNGLNICDRFTKCIFDKFYNTKYTQVDVNYSENPFLG